MISAKIDVRGLEVSAQNLARSTARCALSDLQLALFNEFLEIMDIDSKEFEHVIDSLNKITAKEKVKYKPITGYSIEDLK